MEKVIRDGKVAVLISHGFGAGWSTWNQSQEMLYDPEIVALLESGASRKEIVAAAERKWDGYFGGVDGLRIEWLPVGTAFKVSEYDGAESIEFANEQNWLIA